MYVCICRGVTDREFKDNLKNYEGEIIRTDFCGLEEFHAECSGCGTQCGECLNTLRDDIIEPHNKIVRQIREMDDNLHDAAEEIENTPEVTDKNSSAERV